MKKVKQLITGILLLLNVSSCTVQQFSVNTREAPFENCGRAWGENTKGKVFKKDKDIYVLGFNVRHSNTQQLAAELNATAYSIETKSSILLTLITCGILDYKIVKVIKRDQ